jgi:hypothetical protein
MKNLNKVLLVVVGFGSLVMMSACGSSNTTAASTQNSCGSGYVLSSQYGCVQQTASCTGSNAIVGGNCQYVGTVTGSTTTTSQSCQQGYAWSPTYNSCLQQLNGCVGGYGVYQNSCVPLGTTANTTGHTPYQGSCQSGLVQTSMGCVQQGVCNAGYGFGYWGGQAYCFPASAAF